ncbi:MAG: hypothetical protein WBG01_08570 [Bacteroidota bacterium]
MITRKRFRLSSGVIFVLVALLILLVWLQVVPDSWHRPLLFTAAALILLRLTLRLVRDRQERQHQASIHKRDSAPGGQSAPEGQSPPER